MTAAEPESPCTRECTLDPETDICVGCFRTLAEITGWADYSAQEKRDVMKRIEQRKRERGRPLR